MSTAISRSAAPHPSDSFIRKRGGRAIEAVTDDSQPIGIDTEAKRNRMPLVSFGRFFSGAANGTRSLLGDDTDPLILPRHRHSHNSAMLAKEVTKVALKLKYLYDLNSRDEIIFMMKHRNVNLYSDLKD